MASKVGATILKGGGTIILELHKKARESGFDIGSFMREDRDTSRSRQLQAPSLASQTIPQPTVIWVDGQDGVDSGGTRSGQLQANREADIVKNQGGPVSRGTPGRGGSSDGSNNS